MEKRTITDLSGEGWTFDGEPVSVPHTWNAVDGANGPGMEPRADNSAESIGYSRGAHVYSRSLPPPKKGKRYFIRCLGVSVKAEVFVNGVRIGEHRGAFTAFTFEVTSNLRNEGNKLEIVADNSLDYSIPPVAGDFTMFGGVYRRVELIETGPVCISPLYFGLDGVILDADPDTGKVKANVLVLGEKEEWRQYEYDFGDVVLWSPETPRLYEVAIDIGSDMVTRKVGFRKAEFREDGFYLNGAKRKIRGVCRHQDRDGKGWAISAEDEAGDVAWMKEIGADGVRTSHYPQSQAFFDCCDEQGILAWTEMPLVDKITFSPAFTANALEMAREMVAQLRNHASIILWGVYNEIFNGSGASMPKDKVQEFFAAVNDEIRKADPSRKTVSAQYIAECTELNALTDVQGWNAYPGWYYGMTGAQGMVDAMNWIFGKNPSRKIAALSEYGAGATIAHHNDPLWRPVPNETEYPEEYQAYYHSQAYLAVVDDPRIWGTYLWNLFDIGSDTHREANRYGINNKGIVTGDRKTPKDAFYFYKANWNKSPELHLVGSRMTEIAKSTVNILAFSNVGDVTLKVNGVVVATQRPDRVMAVLFRDVRLEFGKNQIEISAGGIVKTAVWERTPPFSSLRIWMKNAEESWPDAWPVIKRNRGVFDELWFSGGHIEPLERHEERAKWMAEAVAEARKWGFTCSIEFELTIGNTDPCDGKKEAFRNWQGFVGPEGRVGVRCNCPRDPAFHEYFRQVLKRYLVVKPDFVWLDDDVRVKNHGMNSWGCFCDRCVGAFSEVEGKAWTRAELVKAMETDEALKSRYEAHCFEGLAEFAASFSKSVKEFSPDSVMGLQYPWDDDGQLKIVKAMANATGEKIAIRPGSCAYCDGYPFGQILKSWRIGRQEKVLGRLADAYVRWCPEIETYPRNFTTRTPRGLALEPLYHLSQARIDTLSWYVMSAEEDASWFDKTVLAALRKNIAIYKEYAAAGKDAVPCGFTPLDFKVGTGRDCYMPAELSALGIPFCFGEGMSLGTVLADKAALAAASDETLKTVLAGAVIADKASAAYLAERGLVSKEAIELQVEMRTDSHTCISRIADTPFGGKLAIIENWWPYGKRAVELLEYLRLADGVCGERMPLLPEEPAMAAIMPKVRADGSFATAAIVNTRIDEQPSFKVRLRKFAGSKIAWHALDAPFAVMLDVVRDEPGGDAVVAIPAIGPWSGGILGM